MATDKDGKLKTIKVRGYRRRDKARVFEVAVESFDGLSLDQNIEKMFGEIADTWQKSKKDHVDYDLSGSPHSAFVAVVGGEVVGFICNRIYRQRATGHVTNLAVASQFQGQGVGRALVEASLKHFRDKGLRYARIETLEQNEKARGFYPKLGFKEVGRQVFYVKEL